MAICELNDPLVLQYVPWADTLSKQDARPGAVVFNRRVIMHNQRYDLALGVKSLYIRASVFVRDSGVSEETWSSP